MYIIYTINGVSLNQWSVPPSAGARAKTGAWPRQLKPFQENTLWMWMVNDW